MNIVYSRTALISTNGLEDMSRQEVIFTLTQRFESISGAVLYKVNVIPPYGTSETHGR